MGLACLDVWFAQQTVQYAVRVVYKANSIFLDTYQGAPREIPEGVSSEETRSRRGLSVDRRTFLIDRKDTWS